MGSGGWTVGIAEVEGRFLNDGRRKGGVIATPQNQEVRIRSWAQRTVETTLRNGFRLAVRPTGHEEGEKMSPTTQAKDIVVLEQLNLG